MKIRAGFVSNSSSCAFILIFDEKIESEEQLKKILFEEADAIVFHGWSDYSETYETKDMARYIFPDIQREKVNDWEKIMSEIRQYSDYTEDNWDAYSKLGWPDNDAPIEEKESWRKERGKLDRKCRDIGKRYFREFCKKYDFKNKFIYVVEYEDSWGGGMDNLCHSGDPFDNIDVICVSHH